MDYLLCFLVMSVWLCVRVRVPYFLEKLIYSVLCTRALILCRVREQQPTHISVVVATSPLHTRTAVNVSNVATGHATIMRVAALFGLGKHTSESPTVDSTEDAADMEDTSTREDQERVVPSNRRQDDEDALHCQNSGEPDLSLELHDCRIVWKFQQAVASVTGCRLPAALHDFLSLHEDIACLEVPYFFIKLPLMSIEDDVVDGIVSDAAASTSDGMHNSNNNGGHVHPLSQSTVLPMSSSPFIDPFETELTSPRARAPIGAFSEGIRSQSSVNTDTCIRAEGLCLNVATVGYPGRPMLPVLQLPLLALAPDATEGSRRIGRREKESFTTRRLKVDLPSVDVGVHPSHFTTATAAWKLLQQELALLNRDFAEANNTGTFLFFSTCASWLSCVSKMSSSIADFSIPQCSLSDGESIISCTTSAAAQDAIQPTTTLSPTAIAASRDRPADQPAAHGAALFQSVSSSPEQMTTPSSFASSPWLVDISIGVLGVSVVGSMPSSTCLKIEWHDICAHLSGTNSASSGRPSVAASLAWHVLTLHAMDPKDSDDFTMDATPWFPSGFVHSVSDGNRSPVAHSHAHAGTATVNSIFRSNALQAPTPSVRRSLSAGLGLAGAATESPRGSAGFHDPGSMDMMARLGTSSAVSRYFSAADSEFEDANSELPDGACGLPRLLNLFVNLYNT